MESMTVKIKEVRQEISETDDPRVSWEFLKYKMRQFARQYSITRASGHREKRITLEKKYTILSALLVNRLIQISSKSIMTLRRN